MQNKSEKTFLRYKEAIKAAIRFLPVGIISALLIYSLNHIDNENYYRMILLTSKIFIAFYLSNIIYYLIAPTLKANIYDSYDSKVVEHKIKITFLRILLYIGTAIALTI